MKRTIFIMILFFGIILIGKAQEFRKVNNEVFKRGEELYFKAYYDAVLTGKVVAGMASLKVTDENKVIGGRNTYHVVGVGKSMGWFNMFFKVVDNYETYIDEEGMFPWVFIRRVNEGGYKISQDITFDQRKCKTISQKKTITTPKYVQDIISAFYYARTYDFTNAVKGDIYPVDFYIDDSVYVSKIIYLGKETVTTDLGTFNCLKFKPSVAVDQTFKEPYPMTLWVTDDKNRMPILAESGIRVGKVKLELVKYVGLANPLTSKIK
jgi:hypothetical protein